MTPSSSTPNKAQQDIEAICLRLLARREHSQKELLDKLSLRGFTQEQARPVVESLAAQNWQNDERYAESYVRQRIASGYGPLRIRYELQQRGISDIDLQAAAQAQGGWPQLLQTVYDEKYGRAAALSPSERLKRSRFLQQRGFSGEMINRLFKTLSRTTAQTSYMDSED